MLSGCGWSIDAELLFGVGAEAFGRPGRSPDHVYGGVADAGELLQARFYLGTDIDVLRAALRCQRQVDGDILFVVGCGVELYGIDEAEVDDINRDLGVVAAFERAQDVLFGDWHVGNSSVP